MFNRLTSPFRNGAASISDETEADDDRYSDGVADTVLGTRSRVEELDDVPELESFENRDLPSATEFQTPTNNTVVLSREEYEALLKLKQMKSSDKIPEKSFLSKRKDLPKIEYSKLVTLSLVNFSDYRESIKNVGYARGWPCYYSQPSLSDLTDRKWDGVDRETDDDILRREAYLVLYQMIPLSLKYLVKGVKSGDVLGLWVVLYKRFLRVTDMAIKALKKEWECLSMDSTKLRLDEFISLVSSKAENLRMVGIQISDSAEASALLCGLSEKFEWIKRYYSLQEKYNFSEVATEALKYATDKHLLSTGKNDTGGEGEDSFCLAFNIGSCKRKGCKFPHKKVSDKRVNALKNKLESKKKNKEETKPQKVFTIQKGEKKKGSCYKCGSSDHYSNTCPLKEKIDTYIKSLKGGGGHAFPIILFSEKKNEGGWVLDGGATEHVTNDLSTLSNTRVVPPETVVFTVGNNHVMIPTHVGEARVNAVLLTRVYFCENCPVKLVSEGRLLLAGADIKKFADKQEALVSKGNLVVFRAPLRANLFTITQAVDESDILQDVSSREGVSECQTPLVSDTAAQ